MHLTRIEYQGLPPIKWATFDLDRQVNLFIGSNASGKSTTLRAIKELHSLALEGKAHFNPEENLTFTYPGVGLATSDNWPRDASGIKWNAVPFLYIPAVRVNLPGMDSSGQKIQGNRGSPMDAMDHVFGLYSNVPNILDLRELELVIDFFQGEGDHRTRRGLQLAVLHGYNCAKSICNEVVHDYAPHTYVEEEHDEDFAFPTTVHHYMGIGTSDSSVSGALYAGALSSGTQITLLWVRALALRMAHYYGWADGWERNPAILLIDEIENHLHPTWQRRVIPELLEHFPGLQIFATTHSPFVVAGLKAGQVHLLKRDENGNVTATTNKEDIVGWTADEILRNLMGVEDPTDNETAQAAREFRQLRNEGPRSEPEQEAERQSRMEELRRFLSRELLAGGAEAAQRELFERQFAEALEKYRRSQELNQENG